jgi:thioredoxin reductase (NADPH)
MSEVHKVTIIGSGPAGYTAAIYAARANLKPVMFAGGPADSDPARVPGGQLMITNDVENYPGFPESVTGPDLMERFKGQAERFGTVVHMENVVKVDFSKRPFHVVGENQQLHSQTVIIATGASAKWLGVKGEGTFKNKGVSACATCDGFFYKQQDVLVIGGGDTAMEEATYLTKMCRSVTVIHRRDTLRASAIMQERALKNPKIKFLWNSAIDEIVGDAKGVTGALVKNFKTNETNLVPATGVFVAIGHVPTTELFKGVIDMHDNGYLKVKLGSTATNIPGVFACGDVADHYYRQAVTAAGTGCMAAIDAERWMTEHDLG